MGEPLTRILLDTDLAMGAPGSDIDDGFALALALAEPRIAVELVTTVGGNSDVTTSTRLTRELLGVLDHPEVGQSRYEGYPVKFSRTPARMDRGGPLWGEHNQHVYGHILGLSDEEIARLAAESVI